MSLGTRVGIYHRDVIVIEILPALDLCLVDINLLVDKGALIPDVREDTFCLGAKATSFPGEEGDAASLKKGSRRKHNGALSTAVDF